MKRGKRVTTRKLVAASNALLALAACDDLDEFLARFLTEQLQPVRDQGDWTSGYDYDDLLDASQVQRMAAIFSWLACPEAGDLPLL